MGGRLAHMSNNLPLNYRSEAFAGTAEYYARFRPPYPRELFDDLIARATLSHADRLLDLAVGTGRVALPLAPLFAEVVAVDLEPEMIAEGKKGAARLGIANIAWRTGAAEELVFAENTFDLVTVGDAFHRVDQPRVARRVLNWLAPGGTFALIGSRIFFDGDSEWERTVTSTVRKWAGLPASDCSGETITPEEGLARELALLRNVGFADVANFDFTAVHTWTAESIVGYHFSTSFASRNVLGSSADAFAADMQRALTPLGDEFRQQLSFGYIVGRKSSGCSLT